MGGQAAWNEKITQHIYGWPAVEGLFLIRNPLTYPIGYTIPAKATTIIDKKGAMK